MESTHLALSGRGSYLGPIGYSYGTEKLDLSLGYMLGKIVGWIWSFVRWQATDRSHEDSALELTRDGLTFDGIRGRPMTVRTADIAGIGRARDVLGRRTVVIRLKSGKRYWLSFGKNKPADAVTFVRILAANPAIAVDPGLRDWEETPAA